MIPRYSRPEMAALFSDEHRYATWFRVEMAALDAWAEVGRVPWDAVRAIRQKASFDAGRIEEIESVVRHDVIAFTQAVAESVGEEARYFHYGLTSSDVTDTAQAIVLVEAIDAIAADVKALRTILAQRARQERDTIIVGRTHGMYAEPMSLALKFALWHATLGRDGRRLEAARQNLAKGKLSGAIGTYMEITPTVEAKALAALGLRPAAVSTQVLDRDAHAEYLSALAILGGTLEKMALEVRLLQRSEVRELGEPFARGQKGSSAMPHKRNPVVSERICGQARLLRAYAGAGFEDIALWHERDISHSSTERVALADASILADFMLADMAWLMEGLVIDRERMAAHVDDSGGIIFSQRVLLALVERGLTREEAYAAVQAAAMEALGGGDFREALRKTPKVAEVLDEEAFAALFDVERYLRHTDFILERALGDEGSGSGAEG